MLRGVTCFLTYIHTCKPLKGGEWSSDYPGGQCRHVSVGYEGHSCNSM